MLVHVTENNSRTRKNINFATSNGNDDAIADAPFVDMLNCGRFENALQQWHQSQGLVVQPIGDATINSAAAAAAADPPAAAAAAGVVGIASAAPALVVAQTSDAAESFDCEDSDDEDVSTSAAGLTLPEDNVAMPLNNIQDLFDLADD
jgi:hypothetical protein